MIRQHHQPQSPEDIVRVLSPLSESILQSVIAEKSKAMDLEWLDVMVEQDLIDMEDITLWSMLTVSSIEDVTLAWGKRIDAFLGFLQAGVLVEQRQEFAGRPDAVHQLAALSAPASFKAWFDKAAALVVTEHNDSIGRMNGPLGGDAQQAMTQTLARWAMAACMLDRPQVVKNMLAIDDQVAEAMLPLSVLGPQMAGMAMPKTDVTITPVFVAVQFSSEACIDALLPMCKDPMQPVLGSSKRQDSTMDEVRMGKFPAVKPLLWGSNLSQPFFVPMCDMATHAKMSSLAMQSESENAAVKEGAFRAMRSEYMDKVHHYIPAFKAAGVFDLAPLEYAQKACVAGYAGIVQGLRGIDWDKLSDVTILNAARAHDPSEPKGHPEAICALIDQAIADGCGAKAMAMTKGFNPKGMDPIQEIVSKNMESVLLKYLDNGLSATAPLVDGGLTLTELCEKSNPAMLNVVRSHGARRTAHSLIDEIMTSSKNNAPRP